MFCLFLEVGFVLWCKIPRVEKYVLTNYYTKIYLSQIFALSIIICYFSWKSPHFLKVYNALLSHFTIVATFFKSSVALEKLHSGLRLQKALLCILLVFGERTRHFSL